jgi:hypothetical protein
MDVNYLPDLYSLRRSPRHPPRQAVILNLPWMVKKFLDMIFKFVDPVTKAKVSRGVPHHG